MEINSWGRKPVVREKKNKCEIVVERTPKGGVRKRILGECSPQQLRALSDSRSAGDFENDEP